MKTKLLTREEAKTAGFAPFNRGPHLCVELPPGNQTITVKTADGRLITFAFLPTISGPRDNGDENPQNAVDIKYHNPHQKGQHKDNPVQDVRVFGAGRDSFGYQRKKEGEPEVFANADVPPTLTTVFMYKF